MIGMAFAPMWATTVTGVAIALDFVSRRWRRHDAALWHQIWATVIVSITAGFVCFAVMPAPLIWRSTLVPAWVGAEGLSFAWMSDVLLALPWVAAAVSSVLLLRLWGGWLRLWRLTRLAHPADGADADRLAAAVAAFPGGDILPIEFRTHPRVSVPATIGWRRPMVLLPVSWVTWSARQLTVVAGHEIAHIRRRDYLWNLAAAIAESALWFVPAVWIASRRLRLCAELAADDQVSAGTGRLEYARHLIDTAADLGSSGRPATFSLSLGVTTDLRRRVESLLDPRRRPPAAGRCARAVLTLLAMALVVAGMAFRAAPLPSGAATQDHTRIHAQRHHH